MKQVIGKKEKFSENSCNYSSDVLELSYYCNGEKLQWRKLEMNKVIEKEKAYDLFRDGQRIMIGGFAEVGTPFTLIDGLIERNIKDLVIIVNDAGRPKMAGVAPLFERNLIKKAITSFVGSNPDACRQLEANEFEIELVPQGTLCERIRCGGSGLGGSLGSNWP